MSEVKLYTITTDQWDIYPTPATPDEIKEAHAELCEREGMKRYELCGQVLWLNEQAGAMLTYVTRDYTPNAKGAEGG